MFSQARTDNCPPNVIRAPTFRPVTSRNNAGNAQIVSRLSLIERQLSIRQNLNATGKRDPELSVTTTFF